MTAGEAGAGRAVPPPGAPMTTRALAASATASPACTRTRTGRRMSAPPTP